MAKFRCLISGNIVEFTHQVDIDSMVGHDGYVKVEEQEVEALTETDVVKKRAGRPPKNKDN
jgi:hypothetical protein